MTASSDDEPDDFAATLLRLHNEYRALHGSPPLKWSAELANQARAWAKRLAHQRHVSFQEQCGVGENITFFPLDITPEKVVEHWYTEHEKYEYETPGWQTGTNYFTQVVWKTTEELGLARVPVEVNEVIHASNGISDSLTESTLSPTSPKKKISLPPPQPEQVIVAFYRPSGNNNRAGLFAVNVPKPLSQRTPTRRKGE